MAEESLPLNLSIDNLTFAPHPKKGAFRDLTGSRFGRLLVLGYKGPNVRGQGQWYCKCDCGKIAVAVSSEMKNGKTRSCGCLKRGMLVCETTHGMSYTRVYSIWRNMKSRCSLPCVSSYRHYGAIGITVCERWRESFENFYADMGDPPSPHHTLDRYDNKKGYSPENCRWATQEQQQNNKERGIRKITLFGRTQSLARWAREFGLDDNKVRSRVHAGWSIERALGISRK